MIGDIHELGGGTLAYLGDALIELYIREALLSFGVYDTGRLSAAAQKLVCAPTQSAIAEELLPHLSEEEAAAYRLGRNFHTTGKPKRATAAEYSRATGLEAVFGYLYFTEKNERSKELFFLAYDSRIKALRDSV